MESSVKRTGIPFGVREQAWCLTANRWGARRVVRMYFRAVSRLGDGAFWYALMLTLALVDGWRGLDAAGFDGILRTVHNGASFPPLTSWRGSSCCSKIQRCSRSGII